MHRPTSTAQAAEATASAATAGDSTADPNITTTVVPKDSDATQLEGVLADFVKSDRRSEHFPLTKNTLDQMNFPLYPRPSYYFATGLIKLLSSYTPVTPFVQRRRKKSFSCSMKVARLVFGQESDYADL